MSPRAFLHGVFDRRERNHWPPELEIYVRRLALEMWGEGGDTERRSVATRVKADLALRAEDLFGLDVAAEEVERHRVASLAARLKESAPPSGWRAAWHAVTTVRARRAQRQLVADEAQTRAAAQWSNHCTEALMATFDIEFARGQRAAARSRETTVPRTREENGHVDIAIN